MGVSGSLGLTPGKSKLKDKLSAIRQDRAERRESLQKQDAIHEVDSSEDETDEGSEDSQDGRRGTTFTPPPLLRPTTVRSGPGGTLPSLCLSPSAPHATFTHTGPPQPGRPSPSHALTETRSGQSTSSSGPREGEDSVRHDRKVLEQSVATKPTQGPLPFSTPGSAFISVSKTTTPQQESKILKEKPGLAETRAEDRTMVNFKTTVPFTTVTPSTPDYKTTTTTTQTRTTDCQTPESRESPRSSCSSPGIPKEKKEADNRRLCAAAAAACLGASVSTSGSSSNSGSSSPVPPPESSMDRVVSQLAIVAKSVLGPVKLSTTADKTQKDHRVSRGGTPQPPPAELQAHRSSPTRQKTERVSSPTTSLRSAKPMAQSDCTAAPQPSHKDIPGRPTTGPGTSAPAHRPSAAAAASVVSQPTMNLNPPTSAVSEPQRWRSDTSTSTSTTAAANTSSTPTLQLDKATFKKT